MSAEKDELREKCAEIAHSQWSGWMKYMLEKGILEPHYANGKQETVWIMPAWAVERWTRQMNTPYADLPEEEKESDRLEADKYLAVIA